MSLLQKFVCFGKIKLLIYGDKANMIVHINIGKQGSLARKVIIQSVRITDLKQDTAGCKTNEKKPDYNINYIVCGS